MSDTPKPDIYTVLLEFQKNPPSLLKDTTGQVQNRKYKYIDLGQVVERVVGRLNELDCLVLQPMGGRILETVIRHVPSGTETSSVAALPATDNPQDMGKSITYLRRYSLLSLLSLVGDDDDGAGFTSPNHTTVVSKKPIRVTSPPQSW